MMNFLGSIENIKKSLKEIGKEQIADEILECQLALGTGGEVLMSVCSRLLELKRNDPDTYEVIREHATRLIDLAHSIGLYPK